MKSFRRMSAFRILGYVITFIVAGYFLAPVLWLIMSSVVPEIYLYTIPLRWIPPSASLTQFYRMSSDSAFWKALRDSLILSSFSTMVAVTLASIGAFAFARLKFPGKKHILISLLAIQVLPGIAWAIPIFIIMKRIGLFDTYEGLILAEVAWLMPFVVWILFNFFQSIPMELDKAAIVDGCSRFNTLTKIILPLSGPGFAAVVIFCFMTVWGDFFFPLILTASKVVPLTIYISSIMSMGRVTIDYPYMSAVSLITVLPVIILVVVFQKYIVAGIVAGSVKG